MEVIVIDEERYFAETVQSILEIDGFRVTLFSEASSALQRLSDMTPPPRDFCVLVDVALAPGSNREVFAEEATDKYLMTGIVLCQKLFEMKPAWKLRSQCFVLYTAHFTGESWRKISSFADSAGIGTWQKRPDASGAEIVELVRNRL